MSPDVVVTQRQIESFQEQEQDDRPEVVQVVLDEDKNPAFEVGQLIDDESQRREVERKLSAWLTIHTIERIILAIREAVARSRKSKVHSLAGYTSKLLANWQEGQPTPRLAKAPALSAPSGVPTTTNTAILLEDRRRLHANTQDRDRARIDAWLDLDPAKRTEIEAAIDVEYPAHDRPPAKAWRAIRLAYCVERAFG